MIFCLLFESGVLWDSMAYTISFVAFATSRRGSVRLKLVVYASRYVAYTSLVSGGYWDGPFGQLLGLGLLGVFYWPSTKC